MQYSPTAYLKRHKFSRREIIPLETSYLWHIDTGCVRAVTLEEDGTFSTLGFWRAGDVIGKFLSQMGPFHIECLTDAEMSRLPSDRGQCQAALASHYYQAQELLRIVGYNRVESRLVNFLDWLVKEFGRQVEQGFMIDLRLTHQDIADVIRTTRVSVTRLLNKLESCGKITWQKQGSYCVKILGKP